MILEDKVFVLIDNLKINYEEEGNGKPLILLHGWKNDLEIWNGIVPLLNDYRVIRLDLPGFGKSDLPPRAWNVSDYAVFLNKFLEKLNIPKIVLIGHSFGGRIVIKFSVLYPEKVSKLTLVDSGGVRLKNLRKFFAFILAKLGKVFWLLPFIREKRDEIREKFYKALKAKDYLEKNRILRETFLKVIKEDLRGESQQIKIPTLIIWGGKDFITLLKEGKILKQSIKNSRLEIIKDATHWPFLEKEKEFLEILRRFLENK